MPEGIGENISPLLYFQSLIHWFLTIHIIYYSYMPLNAHFSEKVVTKCPTVLPLHAKYNPNTPHPGRPGWGKTTIRNQLWQKCVFELRVTERRSTPTPPTRQIYPLIPTPHPGRVGGGKTTRRNKLWKKMCFWTTRDWTPVHPHPPCGQGISSRP